MPQLRLAAPPLPTRALPTPIDPNAQKLVRADLSDDTTCTATLRSGKRGRPHKFGRPSRAVTLTLPEDVIHRLSRVDADVSRAVVRLVEARARDNAIPLPPAALATFGNRAVILVTPAKDVRGLPGIELVPLFNGRALIALDEAVSIADLELKVRDALDDPRLPASARLVLSALAAILRDARQSGRFELRTRRIIILRSKRVTRR